MNIQYLRIYTKVRSFEILVFSKNKIVVSLINEKISEYLPIILKKLPDILTEVLDDSIHTLLLPIIVDVKQKSIVQIYITY